MRRRFPPAGARAGR